MDNNSLYHHGIKGQKWGVRRFQNKNGTLTSAGRKRYAKTTEPEKPKELTTEEKKAKVLKSRSAKELYDNRKLFNYDEMNKQKQLLALDNEVKNLIVEEPSKIKKFLTEAADYAEKVKNLVTPVVGTLKELEKLSGGSAKDNKSKDSQTKDAKTNDNKPKNDKPKDSQAKDAKTNDNKSKDSKPKDDTAKSKSNIYDVDFEDITNAASSAAKAASVVTAVVGAGAAASRLLGSSVSSLPPVSSASSETKALISSSVAGYLPGPKEDD